jgi:hypothetical protein
MVEQFNRRNRVKSPLRVWSVVGALLLCVVAQSQTLTVTGSDWAPVVPAITEAGSDYGGTYASPSGQFKLNVTVPLLLGTGKVSVRYEDYPIWHSSLKIDVQKIDNGSGLCVLCSMTPNMAGPVKELTTIDSELFRMTAVLSLATVTNITLNLRLRGVSVTTPVDNYSARIVFTIGPT